MGKNNIELFTLEKGDFGQIQLSELAQSVSEEDFRGVVLGIAEIWGVNEKGFHGNGSRKGDLPRWTNGNGQLSVPVDPEDPPKEMVVDLLGSAPVELDLQIKVNGITVHSGMVAKGRSSLKLDLDVVEPSEVFRIELLSESWVPMEEIPGSIDRRKMGVLVAGVTLR